MKSTAPRALRTLASHSEIKSLMTLTGHNTVPHITSLPATSKKYSFLLLSCTQRLSLCLLLTPDFLVTHHACVATLPPAGDLLA